MSRYSDLKNIQILVALLKEHNIKKIIASPGAMNIAFTGSIQNDEFFEIYSCVDERSAAYMACGLVRESGEPVALTCTGATASRNYAPGLTEAYYDKLPVLAITAAQHPGKIGHNIPQILDRTVQFKDIVKKSVQLLPVHTTEDEWACNTLVNDALLELSRDGGGPVHVNLVTSSDQGFTAKTLPKVRKISRVQPFDNFPDINHRKIAIFIGAHRPIARDLERQIEEFCEKYNAFVLCDRTSNYYGKYRILGNIIYDQDNCSPTIGKLDLVIHIGNISGSYMHFETKEVYRVNADGEVRDTFQKLTHVFAMDETAFFRRYNSLKDEHMALTNYAICRDDIQETLAKIDEDVLPLSNIWIARQLSKSMPDHSNLHLGILNSLRAWNYCDTQKEINVSSNTGGFGIDGPLSTALGASLCNVDQIQFCVVGDLAFFYDMNALGNKNVPSNLRILLINNGCGAEFHNYNHYAHVVGDEQIGAFIAADGHFGNQSSDLVKNYAENLGFQYYSARTKLEFATQVSNFVNIEPQAKPVVFEVFTTSSDESDALNYIRNLRTDATEVVKNKVKKGLKKVVPTKVIRKAKAAAKHI